jgi:hypothetical protein
VKRYEKYGRKVSWKVQKASIAFHYSTCLFSIFSISFHFSTYFSSIFFISFHISSIFSISFQWWQTFVRNVIIEINDVIIKIKWRERVDNQWKGYTTILGPGCPREHPEGTSDDVTSRGSPTGDVWWRHFRSKGDWKSRKYVLRMPCLFPRFFLTRLVVQNAIQ